MSNIVKAPWPAFGGKSKVAALVWSRLGNCDNYVEPFANSAAVLLARPRPFGGVETLNDLNCVAPDTHILRDDLTWTTAAAVREGDVLVGFDEFNGEAREGFRAPTSYRKWRLTKVTGVRRLVKPCYRLTFDDGTVVVASDDHLWLGGSHVTGGRGWRWQTTKGLVCNRETQRSWLLKLCPVVEREESWEAGWLAGFFDGEGSVSATAGWRLVVTQKPGPALSRAESFLRARGFHYSRSDRESGVSFLMVNGGMREVLRFLMLIRPERLVTNALDKLPTKSLYGREKQAVGLVGKEFLGNREVVAIETDCHTFIAEGLASHNCYITNAWRAIRFDPEGVVEWCDAPVNELDLHANHRWLVLSEDARAFRERLRSDPDYFDAKFAGRWIHGACCWIGGGWCEYRDVPSSPHLSEQLPDLSSGGVDANPADQQRRPLIAAPHSEGGRGVHEVGEGAAGWKQLPDITSGRTSRGGCGVHAAATEEAAGLAAKVPRLGARFGQPDLPGVLNPGGRPQLADAYDVGRGVNSNGALGTCDARRAWLLGWFRRLQDRLRLVRVCCGDFMRIIDSPSVTTRLGRTGIFFDAPYRIKLKSGKGNRAKGLYQGDDAKAVDDVVDRVIAYCLERGSDPMMRIAACGYEGEGYEVLLQHSWEEVRWSAGGGYANQRGKKAANADRERIFFSPNCDRQAGLFDGLE